VAAVVIAVVLLQHHSTAPGYGTSDTSGSDAPAFGSSETSASASSDNSSDPAAGTGSTGGAAAGSIVVDVGGRVRKPGLVTLPAGARVADAIAAAGGPLHHREVATIDLAARVSDGQLLLVGVSNPGSGDAGTKGASDPGGSSLPGAGATGSVGLNAATLEQLETLPGVGPVTAQKIIDWRTANNGFTDISQLQQVPGIGPAKYAELSPLVTP
jgi:competence protein ComEA